MKFSCTGISLNIPFPTSGGLLQEEIESGTHFGKENALGFHIPGLFDKVLDIEECHLQPEPSDSIRNAVRDYAVKK